MKISLRGVVSSTRLEFTTLSQALEYFVGQMPTVLKQEIEAELIKQGLTYVQDDKGFTEGNSDLPEANGEYNLPKPKEPRKRNRKGK